MKKSFILILATSLLFTACGWLYSFTDYETMPLKGADVCKKTTHKPFTELNEPLVFTVAAYAEDDINHEGQIAVIFDKDKEEVFDWIYIDSGTLANDSIANEFQATPESPLTYLLYTNSCSNMYYLDPAGTSPRVYKKNKEGNSSSIINYLNPKPRYYLFDCSSYLSSFITDDTSLRNGVLFNTLDCTNGEIGKTFAKEQENTYPEIHIDSKGLYWFTSDQDLYYELSYADPYKNTVVTVDWKHSMYPDDVLQELLAKADEDDPDGENPDGEDPDDNMIDSYGWEDMEVRYVSDSKIYIFCSRTYPSEEDYEYKDYIIVVDRNTWTSKEYCISDCEIARNLYWGLVIEIDGKLLLLSSEYVSETETALTFYSFDENAEDKDCIVDEEKKLLVKDYFLMDNIYVRGSKLYLYNHYYDNDCIYIYWIDLTNGETKSIPIALSSFSCPK